METQSTGNDRKASGAFARRLMEIINDGGLSLLLSIGHRTGLFDAMAELRPSSAAKIAQVSGLDPECVREWLDAMASAGIVRSEAAAGTYELPSEHAACLSREALAGNLAALADHVPALGSEEDRIVEHFRRDGAIPFSACPCFRHVVAHGSDEQIASALSDWILPLVPGLSVELERGIRVLDLGCGDGRALLLMASRFPRSWFRGYDASAERIDRARWKAFDHGLTNIRFETRSLDQIDETDRYDLTTDFDAIRGEWRPRDALAQIERALRPGGTLVMQEVAAETVQAEDVAPLVGSALYSMSHLRRLVTRLERERDPEASWREGEPVRHVLRDVGFEEVSVHRLPHEIHNRYFVARKRGGVAAPAN